MGTMSQEASQMPALALYDAHNHLQDERLAFVSSSLETLFSRENIRGTVVNGSCEADWAAVQTLANKYPQVIPSFGYHPWYIKERSADWQMTLTRFLDESPSAIGEIGLDRWIKDHDLEDQQQVFVWQLRLASERNLPVSIHCLQAWGKLFDLLRSEPRPSCGFVLHSFGGPEEMVEPLAKLGAYFSLPGYFAHERKTKQREAFRRVPPDRLLIETDAPDQPLPPERVQYPLTDPKTNQPLNHPGNLAAVYRFAAELFREPLDTLAKRIEANFHSLFAPINRRAPAG
jgi:TatD DNase family protein